MEILGDRKYVEIPGDRTHELPPLLVRGSPDIGRSERVVGMAAEVVESEGLVSDLAAGMWSTEEDVERRKFELAINLVEQYLGLILHWRWGDSILDWIRQCETTFDARPELRPLLRPDVWPHAGRGSFVALLEDKAVPTHGVELPKAVGLRLTFREPPPLKFLSDQFLFYLNSVAAISAYQRWVQLTPEPHCSLPPERFQFDVVEMSL